MSRFRDGRGMRGSWTSCVWSVGGPGPVPEEARVPAQVDVGPVSYVLMPPGSDSCRGPDETGKCGTFLPGNSVCPPTSLRRGGGHPLG